MRWGWVLALGAMLGMMSCATTALPPSRGVEGGLPLPRADVATASSAPASDGVVARWTFYRPAECGKATRGPNRRNVRNCASEERLEASLLREGRLVARPLQSVPARNPYPVEIASRWRHCAGQHIAELDARSNLMGIYEDPDLPRCYLIRNRDPDDEAAVARSAQLRKLDGLHPYLVDAVTELVLTLRDEGIAIKVISGLRANTKRESWVTKTVKKKGKKVKTRVKHTTLRKTWHTWGLGVDVNLSHHNTLSGAVSKYRHDPKERRAWIRIGQLGEQLGMKWLGTYDDHEIFHFEWAPTWPGLPRGDLHDTLVRTRDRGGLEAVWERLRFDPSRGHAFRHLLDGPD